MRGCCLRIGGEGVFNWAIGKLGRSLLRFGAIALVSISLLGGCGNNAEEATVAEEAPPPPPPVERIVEVAPPSTVQALEASLAAYQPQVRILSPQPDEVIEETCARVELEVRDYPIYKDDQWQLGPHVNLVLDDEPARAVYDLDSAIALCDLEPGTHTLRTFAARPWEEGFKNEGAYAETTFHLYAKTGKYAIAPETPLMTYNSPQGHYGAQPILLDYYLTNAPLRLLGESGSGSFDDWRVRVTVNGQSFLMDEWMPVYLQGFHPGTNWVQVEAIDGEGNAIVNGVYNNTVRLVTYEPNGEDALSKIARSELESDRLLGIVDPNYRTSEEPEPAPIEEPVEEPQPEAETPSETESADEQEIEIPSDRESELPGEDEVVSEEENVTSDRESSLENQAEFPGEEISSDTDASPESEPEAEEINDNSQATPEVAAEEEIRQPENESDSPDAELSGDTDASSESEPEEMVGDRESEPAENEAIASETPAAEPSDREAQPNE